MTGTPINPLGKKIRLPDALALIGGVLLVVASLFSTPESDSGNTGPVANAATSADASVGDPQAAAARIQTAPAFKLSLLIFRHR